MLHECQEKPTELGIGLGTSRQVVPRSSEDRGWSATVSFAQAEPARVPKIAELALEKDVVNYFYSQGLL